MPSIKMPLKKISAGHYKTNDGRFDVRKTRNSYFHSDQSKPIPCSWEVFEESESIMKCLTKNKCASWLAFNHYCKIIED